MNLLCVPERIDRGNGVFKVGNIPKVVGGVTPVCTRLAVLFYRQITANVVILTDHAESDYRRIVEIAPLIVDSRNVTARIAALPADRAVAL